MHAVGRIAYGAAVPNVQASWPKMGQDGARQVLQAGANDLGGTLVDENISRVSDHTSSCIRRKNTSSSGSRTAISSRGNLSASLNLDVHLSPSAALIPFSSPLDRPSENAKTVERSMAMPLGLRSSTTVWRTCHGDGLRLT